jgi:hypothetical protein
MTDARPTRESTPINQNRKGKVVLHSDGSGVDQELGYFPFTLLDSLQDF